MTKVYYRPIDIVEGVSARRALDDGQALALAGGSLAFKSVEVMDRKGLCERVPATELSRQLKDIVSPREPIAGLSFDQPEVMAIFNVTPDSFSDGGDLGGDDVLVEAAKAAEAAGATLLDIGGESTRPGSDTVSVADECERVLPALRALRAITDLPLSIDSRKPEVFAAAVEAGAGIINDVSALTYSDQSLPTAKALDVPICLMHAQGDPKTMQDDPAYEDVLLDVYDWLEERIGACEAAGIMRSKLIVDPGIGFGKTLDHNLRLLGGLSLFHGLGCPLLLGASRKSFIHKISPAPEPKARIGGSLAALATGRAQGAQIFRVHDVFETSQALTILAAIGRNS